MFYPAFASSIFSNTLFQSHQGKLTKVKLEARKVSLSYFNDYIEISCYTFEYMSRLRH